MRSHKCEAGAERPPNSDTGDPHLLGLTLDTWLWQLA